MKGVSADGRTDVVSISSMFPHNPLQCSPGVYRNVANANHVTNAQVMSALGWLTVQSSLERSHPRKLFLWRHYTRRSSQRLLSLEGVPWSCELNSKSSKHILTQWTLCTSLNWQSVTASCTVLLKLALSALEHVSACARPWLAVDNHKLWLALRRYTNETEWNYFLSLTKSTGN